MNVKDSTLIPKQLLLNANMTFSERQKLFGEKPQQNYVNKQSPKHLLESYGKQLPESVMSPQNPNNIQFLKTVGAADRKTIIENQQIAQRQLQN